MGEAYKIKTDQSLCLTTSLTSLDFLVTTIQENPNDHQPIFVEVSKQFTGTYEKMLGKKNSADLHELTYSKKKL